MIAGHECIIKPKSKLPVLKQIWYQALPQQDMKKKEQMGYIEA